jgi:hypothetical protein
MAENTAARAGAAEQVMASRSNSGLAQPASFQDTFSHEGGTDPVLVFSVALAKVLAFAKGTFGQTRRGF